MRNIDLLPAGIGIRRVRGISGSAPLQKAPTQVERLPEVVGEFLRGSEVDVPIIGPWLGAARAPGGAACAAGGDARAAGGDAPGSPLARIHATSRGNPGVTRRATRLRRIATR